MISFLLSKIKDDELRENIASGLVWGLVWGLALGLAGGLVWGLAWGLAWGLGCGLAGGLAGGLGCGLAWGLVVGLTWGIAWPYILDLNFPFSWYVVIGLLLLVGEFIFLQDKSKPNKTQSIWWFTFWHKLEALIEALVIIVNVSNIFKIIQITDFQKLWLDNKETLFSILGWFGIATIGAIIFIGYIWLNSKRYIVGG